MRKVFYLSLLIISACSQQSVVITSFKKQNEISSIEKYVPENDIDYEFAGTTQDKYLECKKDLPNASRDFFRLRYISNGYKIEGYLALPKKFSPNKMYSLIIYHRGGNRDFSKFNACRLIFTNSLLESMNDSILFFSEIRGTTGSEGKDEFGGADIDDAVAAYNIFSNYTFIDQNNKFMLGWSRGTITSFLALKRDLKFNAVAVIASVPDLEMESKSRPVMKRLFENLIPNYKDNPKKAIEERSAIYWPEKLSSPLLIVHGTKDWRAPSDPVMDLDKKLTALNKPHKLILYSDSGHFIDEHRAELKEEIFNWFKKYEVQTLP